MANSQENKFNFRVEARRLWNFLRTQIPRLGAARLERHDVDLARAVIWFVSLRTLGALITQIGWVVTGRLGLNLAMVITLITSTAVLGAIPFLLVIFGGGTWIRAKRDEPLSWDEWAEFVFVCSLPNLIAQYVSIFIPSLSMLTWLAGLCTAGYLLVTGIERRFPLRTEKDRNITRATVAILIALAALSSVSVLNLTRPSVPTNLGSATATQTELGSGGLGPLPQEKLDKISAMYSSDLPKRRAAIQYANAIWRFVNTPDLKEATKQTGRAADCLAVHDMWDSEMNKIKSVVLDSYELTRSFLETDLRLSGTSITLDEESANHPCDF